MQPRRLGHQRAVMLAAFRPRRDRAQLLMLAMLAGALLLRLLVPQGWMPVHAENGWRLEMCSGTGPMTMAMPMGKGSSMAGMHHGSGDRDHDSSDSPCAYSVLAFALDDAPSLLLDLPAPLARTGLPTVFAVVEIGRGLAAPPPPATGPPPSL